MTLALAGQIAFLTALAAAAVTGWLSRPTHRRMFAAIAATAFVLGFGTMYASFASRGPAWLASTSRSFEFEPRGHGALPPGSHHRLISPALSKRLPNEFDRIRRAVEMDLGFVLQPDGSVRDVNIVRSSGERSLDRATAIKLQAWRFGALPAGANGQPETVKLRITNGYHFLRQSGFAGLFALAFIVLWNLTRIILPREADEGKKPNTGAAGRLIVVSGLLAGVGLLLIWRLAPDLGRLDLPEKQAELLLASFAVVAITAWIVRLWGGFGEAVAQLTWVWAVLGVGLLLLTRFSPLGTDLHTGHKLWLKTPIGVFQTVELVKLLLVFFVAGAAYAAAFPGRRAARGGRTTVLKLRTWDERYRGMVGGFAVVCSALILMSDFGPLLLLALLLLFLLYAQGHPRQSLIGAAVLVGVLILAYMVGKPTRWNERVRIWQNPWKVAASDSRGLAEGREHMSRVLWAVGSGGGAGVGIGQGRADQIAAVESDFMFAAIAEELGWMGGTAVLALTLLLVLESLRIAARRGDAVERVMATGIGLLIGVQSALTIGGNLGLWPLTGITLPFVSYGRSSLLVNFLAIGILAGLASRRKETRPLPAEINRRTTRSLRQLSIAFALLFAGLAVKQGWLEWPWSDSPVAARVHIRADGSMLSNSRLGGYGASQATRGRFLDRAGVVLAETTPAGRHYTHPEQLIHILGFESADHQCVGLERDLNRSLIGLSPEGVLAAIFPALGRWPRGNDVVLTLDSSLQARAYRWLERRKLKGCIVGVEPNTGEILIAANRPTLDPATATIPQWLASYDSRRPAPPFCYRRVYAPGSVFKTIVAAAALESGIISTSDTFDCSGIYQPPGYGLPIRDWQKSRRPDFAGHGATTLQHALEVSCNSFFADLGVRLGWERLLNFGRKADFDASLPILPPRWSGPVMEESVITPAGRPAEEMTVSQLQPVYLAQTSIGQRDVRMTPLHLALWAAAIANHGRMMSPCVVKSVRNADGGIVWNMTPELKSTAMSETRADELARMMEAVVARGTGRTARVPGMRVAGKTGTPEEDAGGTNAVFIAFAPVDNPRIALAVVLEGVRGGSKAGPMVADLLRVACGR